MKLVQVWNSAVAWQALANLKKNPKLAYRLLKYTRKIEHEIAICEKHRQSIVYELSGMEAPKDGDVLIVDISTDEAKMAELNKRFNEFLQQPSDLPWIGLTMDDLVEGLSADALNAVSENDIVRLECFFVEPAKPDLSLVEGGKTQ